MTNEVRVTLFGLPRALVGASELDFAPDLRYQCLAYLAVVGDWVQRDDLVYLFWPDTPQDKAREHLRGLLKRVRRLEWLEALESDARRVRWLVASDVTDFRAAVDKQAWAEVVSCYGGPFLQTFDKGAPEFTSWVDLERASFFKAYRKAVFRLSEALETQRRTSEAAELFRNLYQNDTLDEAVLRRYLELLALGGKREEALDVYASFERGLELDVGGEPEKNTRVLADRLRSGEVVTSSVTRLTVPEPETKPRRGLPTPATRFVGRETEIGKVVGQLAEPDCRLLTILGPGGIGKTRLALEVAGRLEFTYQDGVAFVPFGGVSSPDLMVSAVADALHFSFFGPRAPRDQLLSYLENKHMLLVMDNLEHLLDGVTLLTEMLGSAPHLKLLATSRESLNVRAEWFYDLGGLATPAASDKNAQSYDAVHLFLQAAKRTQGNFRLDEANAGAVAHVCRLTGGMPLALELAASWLRVLTPEGIAAELAKGLDTLETSLKDMPERHHGVRNVFEASWQRLSEAEKGALERLSVFQSGFTQEAARDVAEVSLPLLLALVNKSFVRQHVARRFSQHPLLLQFAREKAQGRPEELARTETRHSCFFLEASATLQKALNSSGQLGALQQIDIALEDIHRAWARAVTRGDAERLYKAARPLRHYHSMRGRFQEGLELFSKAIAALEASHSSFGHRLGGLLAHQAHFFHKLGDYPRAQDAATRSLFGQGRAQGVEKSYALEVLGKVERTEGNITKAQAYFEQALSLSQHLGDKSRVAALLWNLGLLEARLKRFAEAKTYMEESLKLDRAIGNRCGEGINLLGLGRVTRILGDLSTSLATLQEASTLFQKDGFRAWLPEVWVELAETHRQLGNRTEAHTLFERALPMAHDSGVIFLEARVLLGYAHLLLDEADFAAAETQLVQARELAQALQETQLLELASEGWQRLTNAPGYLPKTDSVRQPNA